MSRNTLFVTALVAISALSAYVAKRMFDAGTMTQFEMSKMYFAAAVLAFLAFIFLFSIIVYALGPEAATPAAEAPGKKIFDAYVTVIPPLVTLIIGFYFGTAQDKSSIASVPAGTPVQQGAPERPAAERPASPPGNGNAGA